MVLTPEERKRVYEEEKARLEAQSTPRQTPPPRKSDPRLLMWGVVGMVVAVGLAVIVSARTQAPTADFVASPAPPATQQSAPASQDSPPSTAPVSDESAQQLTLTFTTLGFPDFGSGRTGGPFNSRGWR